MAFNLEPPVLGSGHLRPDAADRAARDVSRPRADLGDCLLKERQFAHQTRPLEICPSNRDNHQRMDSPLFHLALRIIVGIASLWCFVMAVTWYRATKEMQRTGNARRSPFTFPADFMRLDLTKGSSKTRPAIARTVG